MVNVLKRKKTSYEGLNAAYGPEPPGGDSLPLFDVVER